MGKIDECILRLKWFLTTIFICAYDDSSNLKLHDKGNSWVLAVRVSFYFTVEEYGYAEHEQLIVVIHAKLCT